MGENETGVGTMERSMPIRLRPAREEDLAALRELFFILESIKNKTIVLFLMDSSIIHSTFSNSTFPLLERTREMIFHHAFHYWTKKEEKDCSLSSWKSLVLGASLT